MNKPKQLRAMDDWEQLVEEFLVMQAVDKSLTIKGFCNTRSDINYNTARVKMTKVLKARKKDDHEDDHIEVKPEKKKAVDQPKRVPKAKVISAAAQRKLDRQAALKHEAQLKRKTIKETGLLSANSSLEEQAEPQSLNPETHGIYSKYFKRELIELAAKGSLHDDLLLYRAKALRALDYAENLNDMLQETLEREYDDLEAKNKAVEGLQKRIDSTDKALSWCITRIESLAKTIKDIELKTVCITHERAKVVSTRAKTKATIQQSNKFKAETKLAKAKANEADKNSKGSTVAEIVREIQTRRDVLPSFVKRG